MSLKSEARRYLGYSKIIIDETTDETADKLIDECLLELEQEIKPKSVFKRFSVDYADENGIETAGTVFKSSALARNLSGCKEVILFSATLGVQADRMLAKYMKLDIVKAAVFQSAAAAFIEDYCDNCQEKLERELAAEGLHTKPRFSPGYGDLPLAYQQQFLDIIDGNKRLGISLTESNLMLPEKSVTAFIGISNIRSAGSKCEACEEKNCRYRGE